MIPRVVWMGVCIIVAGCSRTGVDGGDGSAEGGGDGMVAGDAGYDGVCDPNRPSLPQNTNCNATLDAICQQWAQSAAIGAYGYSKCVVEPVTATRDCGDPDCNGSCCGADPYCGIGQVCASDTPNGPRHCIQACSGL